MVVAFSVPDDPPVSEPYDTALNISSPQLAKSKPKLLSVDTSTFKLLDTGVTSGLRCVGPMFDDEVGAGAEVGASNDFVNSVRFPKLPNPSNCGIVNSNLGGRREGVDELLPMDSRRLAADLDLCISASGRSLNRSDRSSFLELVEAESMLRVSSSNSSGLHMVVAWVSVSLFDAGRGGAGWVSGGFLIDAVDRALLSVVVIACRIDAEVDADDRGVKSKDNGFSADALYGGGGGVGFGVGRSGGGTRLTLEGARWTPRFACGSCVPPRGRELVVAPVLLATERWVSKGLMRAADESAHADGT